MYAARLNGLLKQLATAETAVQESVNARTQLVEAMEKLLDFAKASLASDQAQLEQLSSRKAAVDDEKNEVERSILIGLASHNQSSPEGNGAMPAVEPDRPEVEALTPEPEPLTPEPFKAEAVAESAGPADVPVGQTVVDATHSPAVPSQSHFPPPAAPGIEMLSNLASQYQAVPVSTNGANKRRRVDTGDDFPDLGNDDGIDPDVKEMLRMDTQNS